MAFDLMLFIRGIHIVAAALWVGAAVFMAFRIGLTLKATGSAAGPFIITLLRRGGVSVYFLTLGLITIAAGGYTFQAMHFDQAPFGSAGNTMLTIGVFLAVLAYIHGLAVLFPAERKAIKLVKAMPPNQPPSPQLGQQLQAFGEKQGKHSAISALMLLIVLTLMALHAAF